MQDSLKLAEEALAPFENDGMDRSRDPRTMAIQQALTALRAARAGWGWRPIAEMLEEEPQPVVVGKYPKFRKKVWVTSDGWRAKKPALMNGFTHFYRPQLPPPPAREEVGNG